MTLLESLYQAHHASALRGNCSHHALALSALGSGDYFKAIASALLTLGGSHGPLIQTYDFLQRESCVVDVAEIIRQGKRVPGWGNGFVKGTPDPLWETCDALLQIENQSLHSTIRAITAVLHGLGRFLYPNPSCYTAAVALTIGHPRDGIGELFIRGRLQAWTQEFCRVVIQEPVRV